MGFESPYDTSGGPNPFAYDPDGPVFLCPHCRAATTHALALVELGVLRCGRCSGAFSNEGATLEDELRLAIAAMDQVVAGREELPSRFMRLFTGLRTVTVPYIEGVSTASERAYWLRSTFAQRGLDANGPTFAATRRQLAVCYGTTDPEVAPKATGYRGGPAAATGTYEGQVPNTRLFGARSLEVTPSVIRCGRASVSRNEAVFFSVVPELGSELQVVGYALRCAWGTAPKSKHLVSVPWDGLERLQQVVTEMETALGWLHVRVT